MTDLTVTAASVLPGANAKRTSGVIGTGVTVTAGQSVYIDPADNRVKLADADAVTSAASAGIAELGGGAGQEIPIIYEDDDFTPGATLAVGETYVVSTTAGGIAPIADISSGDFPTHLMVAKSTTKAKLKVVIGGVAKA